MPIFLLSLAFTNKIENTFPLFGHLIILDPGHGSLDPGSIYQEEYEKNYNLLMSKTLKKELENLGASVILTRDGDYDLSNNSESRKKTDFDNRIKLIDDYKPDIYISLHMNSLDNPSVSGPQVFYSETNEKNKTFAELLQSNLNKFTNQEKTPKTIGKDKYMYQRIKSKGVLLEYGFITNEQDRTNIKNEEYRKELSNIIIQSLIAYFT